ncbi:M48 family metallopeptidase [Porphyromonas pogonae]|uniref:M48 family metallopeptidase n=1 Tax=Porphyromonas pogonae TaxID=867595 RepID=UPI002E7631E9|nr:M48 family metallopeptidase [Porphyromonas pogonae]
MNKKIQLFLSTLALSLLIVACGVVPITGRRQVKLLPDQEILQSSNLQYHQFIREAPLSRDSRVQTRVRRVGERIANATMQYLHDNNMQEMAKQMKWEFNVVNSDQINAFCMPGGKIVVYTGILNMVSSDDELATIISHEVSHAVANHSNERISQEMLRRMGGQALGVAVSGQSRMLQTTIGQAYGLGSQLLVTLPYSRTQEYEADKIGMVFMGMAGYNPQAAITLWQKMAARGKGSPAEFMSTHPSDGNRVKALQEFLPQAMKYYGGEQSKTSVKAPSGNKTQNYKTSEKWHF